MNLEELQKDLISKLRNSYFKVKLFQSDKKVYGRRSFRDLFIYYRRKGVTEKLLLEALYKTGFSASVCNSLGQIVFFRSRQFSDRFWTFIKGTPNLFGYRTLRDINTKESKYTEEYLNNLFEQIIDIKL